MLVFQPSERQSINEVAVTRGRIVASIYDNVRGGVSSFAQTNGRWRRDALPAPSQADG